MNSFNVIAKILAAAAVIAGIIFVVIVYGDKIMGFFKKLLGRGDSKNQDFVNDCDLADDEIVAGEQDFDA